MSLFDAVYTYLVNDGWGVQILEPGSLLRTSIHSPSGLLTCVAQIWEERGQLVFYTLIPLKCPPNRRVVAMEFITRANYGMILGNFEIDLDDGEMRYKTSLDVENSEITLSLLKSIIDANWSTADRYLPGLVSVIYGDKPVQSTISAIEGDFTALLPLLNDDDN